MSHLSAASSGLGGRAINTTEVKRKRFRKTLLAGACTAGIFLSSGTAFAQSESESGGEDARYTLDTVRVTAEKREESIMDVPLTVQAVDGAAIAESGIANLEGMKDLVPGLHVGTAGLSEQLFIRGIGSGSNQGFEQSTGIYLDGVYFTIARLSRLSFLDTERVEVLKGPQSTLFGKGTIAGAVNIISARPQDTFGGGMTVNYNLDESAYRSVEGYITGPVAEGISFRLAAKSASQDGFFYNTNKDRRDPTSDDFSIRGSLLADIGENLEVLLTAQTTRANSTGRSQQIAFIDDPTDPRFPRLQAFIDLVLAADPDADFSVDDRRTSGGVGLYDDETGHDEAQAYTLQATYDFGSVALKSVTGYIDANWLESIDADGTPLSSVTSVLGQDIEQFSQEFRLESDAAGPLEYIAGVYYENSVIRTPDDAHSDLRFVDFGLPFDGKTCGTSKWTDNTLGVFGQGTYAISDRLSFTAGARYQESHKRFSKNHIIADPGDICAQTTDPVQLARMGALGRTPFTVQSERDDDSFSPSLTVQFDVTDNSMIYASYRTGFKSGGFDVGQSSLNLATLQFDSEDADSFEVGLKSSVMEGRGQVSVSAFHNTFKDLQVSAFNGTTFTVGNAAEAVSKGVELESRFLVTPAVTLGANLLYLDGKYDSFPGAACYKGQTAATGCVGGAQDLGGVRLQYAPEWSGSLDIDWRDQVWANYEGFVQGALTFATEQFLSPDANPVMQQDGYSKLNLRIGIAPVDQNWELSLVGRNLTDEMTGNFGYNIPLVDGAYVEGVDPGRTVAIQVRAAF